MRVLDLFSGVGMFAYGMEKAGFEIAAFCEIEPWPRRVLAKHWPDVPIYEDVRELTGERLESDGITGIECITAGFPCQDLSTAGEQAGIEGDRSGLWSECARLLSEISPRFAVFENVSALLTGRGGRWFDRVLLDLAQIRYSAEWHLLPAGSSSGTLSAGAPHQRDRIWIIAYPDSNQPQAGGARHRQQRQGEASAARGGNPVGESGPPGNVSYAFGKRGRGRHPEGEHATHAGEQQGSARGNTGRVGSRNTEPGMGLLAHGTATRLARLRWLPEPRIGRVAVGVPDRVQKLKALGNGLVWQIPYAIGCAIMEQHATPEIPRRAQTGLAHLGDTGQLQEKNDE